MEVVFIIMEIVSKNLKHSPQLEECLYIFIIISTRISQKKWLTIDINYLSLQTEISARISKTFFITKWILINALSKEGKT